MAKKKAEKCPCCGHIVHEQDKKCPSCNRSLGMGWYKFIIWFQLIALSIYFVWVGISLIRGTIYGGTDGIANSIALYEAHPALQIVDYIQGAVLIILAVIGLYIRNLLAKRKKDSPRKYLIFMIVVALEPVIYSYAAAFASKAETMGYTLSTMYMSIVLFFVSLVYFKNRARYFNE